MTLTPRLIREICGVSTADIDDALATAQLAHLGQKRRSGEDYIEHPKEVARIVYRYYGDPNLCAAALLHDALEDAYSLGNVKSTAEMASLIAASFGDEEVGREALRIVNRLTHDKGTSSYDEYVLTLLDDPNALKIKLSDMLHNLQSGPSERQQLKYGKALQTLQNAAGGTPPGINSGHWAALQKYAGLDVQTESVVRKFIRKVLNETTS